MSVQEEEIRVSEELAKDPNWVAYQTALKAGQFESMEPGTYVFYHDGQLVGSGMDKHKLLEEIRHKNIERGFLHQVGVPERVIHLPPYITEKLV